MPSRPRSSAHNDTEHRPRVPPGYSCYSHVWHRCLVGDTREPADNGHSEEHAIGEIVTGVASSTKGEGWLRQHCCTSMM